jgi:MFS family permease
MQAVALGWMVYRLTGSALSLGVLGFCTQLPVLLLGPVAGIEADRRNRRRVLLATQTFGMIVSFAIAAITLAGHVQAWHIWALAVLLGCGNAFDFPARQAFIAEIAGKAELSTAIPLNSFVTNAARAVGPAIAGVVITKAGEAWCLLANAASYSVIIVALLLIKTRRRTPDTRSTSVLEGLQDGFYFTRRMLSVRVLLLLLALVSLMGIRYEVLMPVFAAPILRGGPSGYGMLMAQTGIGAAAASLVLAFRKRSSGLGSWVGVSSAGLGIGLILLSVSRSLWLSALLLLAIGFAMVAQLDATNVLIQKMSPDNLRGRVMALWTMMLTGLAPFGSLLTGWLGEHFGAPRAVAAGGAACVMGAIIFGFGLPTLKFQSGTRFDVK